jgi:hypothetical protein
MLGLEFMSNGIQALAVKKIWALLAKVAGTPITGLMAGTFITGVVQSSTAMTVMVVGLVNAGVLGLRPEATPRPARVPSSRRAPETHYARNGDESSGVRGASLAQTRAAISPQLRLGAPMKTGLSKQVCGRPKQDRASDSAGPKNDSVKFYSCRAL